MPHGNIGMCGIAMCTLIRDNSIVRVQACMRTFRHGI